MAETATLSNRNTWIVAVALGASAGCVATLGLLSFGYWMVPAILGLSACLGAALATDFHCYWLAIYALVLPLEIKKMLVDSTAVRNFVLQYGFPVGEPPGPILYLSDIALFMLVAGWFFEIWTKRARVVIPKSNTVAVVLLGWAALSSFNAVNLSSALFELVRMVKLYVLYLYAANNIFTTARVKTLVSCLLIGAAAQGLLCWTQFGTRNKGFLETGLFSAKAHLSAERARQIGSFFSVSGGDHPTDIRASGTAGASDAEAQYFEFILPVGFTLCLAAGRTLKKTAIAVLVLGSAGLVLTFSRGGLIGIATGLVLALLLSYRYRLIGLKTLAAWSIVAATSAVIATPLLYRYLTARPEAVTARYHLNAVGVNMIMKHPIAGVGLNNHLVVKSSYDSDSYIVPLATHNEYILVASQMGIPGAVLFVALLVCFVRAGLRGARRGDCFSAAVSIGLLSAIVAVGVHGSADYIGTYTNTSLLWLYGGLGEALGRAARPFGVASL